MKYLIYQGKKFLSESSLKLGNCSLEGWLKITGVLFHLNHSSVAFKGMWMFLKTNKKELERSGLATS